MPRASIQALRHLEAHNASPEQSGSSNPQRDSTRRESRPQDRPLGGSSRHSNASEEGRIPAWAQTLLDAQKEYGWETVDCYVEEPLASDSDDDEKIRRAIKKSKAMKEENEKARGLLLNHNQCNLD